MESLRQLRLLLWKNWLVQRRQLVWTLFELVLPIILTAVMVFVRQTVATDRRNVTIFEPYIVSGSMYDLIEPVDGQPMLDTCFRPNILFYSPNTTEHNLTNTVMDVVKWHRFNGTLEVIGFSTEAELVDVFTKELDASPRCGNRYLGGIVFQDGFTDGFSHVDEMSELKYKIRLTNTARNEGSESADAAGQSTATDQGWDTNLLYPVFGNLGPRQDNATSGGKPGYWREAFLTLQRAIDISIIQLIAHDKDIDIWVIDKLMAPIALRRFAYPSFIDNPFILVAQQYLPLVFVLSFSLSVLYIIRNIVTEKEKRLKEYMRVMGLSNFIQWVAYFIINYVKLLIVSAAITILLTCPFAGLKIIDRMDPSVMFVFLMIYSANIVCYCFAVSVFFKAGNTAAACGGIIWFVLYLPYLFLQPRYASLSQAAKIFSSFLVNTGMAFAGQIIGSYEGLDVGVQWHNVMKAPGIGDNLTMGNVLIMLVVDCIICLVITWYVEAIFPGDEGVPQPWYFPFTRNYWCGGRRSMPPLMDSSNEELESYSSTSSRIRGDGFRQARVDSEAASAVPQVVLKALTKVYGDGKTKKLAVENLDLKIYFGQITALLGHNGAGKSTTMSMLTGMLQPTSGSVTINGFDISRNLASARQYLGLCPQHNVLFDNLTVYEHLKFFCQLKGRRFRETEVNYLLTALGIEKKQNDFTKNLSGGMKRKLSLAIALIGGSEIVMLDEPTSGMDPGARHDTWHLLQKEKHRRTILFTTHYMEEADLLGDRIAILARGRLQCFGSSMFLKRTFGAGYNMTAIFKQKDPTIVRNYSEGMLKKIRAYVPDAKLQSSIGAESMFILPSERRRRFANLFAELERDQERYGVISFGLSVTTMEEVFLKVCERADAELYANTENVADPVPTEVSDVPLRIGQRNTGLALLVQQFRAMLVKRFLHSLRNWLVLFVQLIIPVAVIIVAMIINRTLPGPMDMPEMELIGDTYGRGTVAVYRSIDVNGGNDSKFLNELSDAYVGQLKNQEVKPLTDGDTTKYVVNAIDRVGQANFDLHNVYAATFISTPPSPSAEDSLVDMESTPNVTAYFNNQAYHGPGVTLNVIDNALLQLAVSFNRSRGDSQKSLKLTTVNHPMPPTKSDDVQSWAVAGVVQFNIAFNLVFAMAFLISSFVVFLVKERVSKAKHLQLLGGVHPLNFWLATWTWDFCNYMLTVIALMIVFVGFNVQPLIGGRHWAHILLLFILYGWASLPMIYVASFVVESTAGAFVKLTIFNIFSGLATIIVVAVLRQPLRLFDAANQADWVFMALFPGYDLGQGLMTYYGNVFVSDACVPFIPFCHVRYNWLCCGVGKFTFEPLSWATPGIGRHLSFLTINGIFYFFVLTLVELGYVRSMRRCFKSCFARRRRDAESRTTNLPASIIEPIGENGSAKASKFAVDIDAIDIDVANESQRIADWRWRTDTTDSVLIAEALEKKYGNFLAVDRLSFAVKRGECFGLLGVNGAGKTSTFQMLTGENDIDDGDALVNGISIRSNWRKAGALVGYCPQFSAVIDQMTGSEMLIMFARIRGIRESYIEIVVAHSLASLGIAEYADKQISTYSGGTKRKLSLAIGLIGSPAVLMLDEPTSGVDPASRRVIWHVLAAVKKKGVAVLLTSHSMDECEALCGRLAIMVGGRFKCIGSPQHLKAKFGQGYTLLVKVREENRLNNCAVAVQETFSGTIVKEIHCRQASFCIPVDGNTWSSLFGALEELVVAHGIVDYSLSQTNLEEIFLNFAQQDQLRRRGSVAEAVNENGYGNAVVNTADE